jgi:hypothetical protein
MKTKTTTTIEIELALTAQRNAFGDRKLTPTLTIEAPPAEISCQLSPR